MSKTYNWIAYLICRACNVKFGVNNADKDAACCPQCGNTGKQLDEAEIVIG